MPGLLVIEQSSTLSNLLVRTLSAGGYPATEVSHDFGRALTLLEQSADGDTPYDAIILGVPPRGANVIKPVLKFLQDDGARSLPLLLVTHDRHPLLERWSAKRGGTESIAWQSFSKIPGALGKLLPEGLSTEPTAVAAARPVRVLFVDDSHSARYAYRQLLETNGFPVEVAATVAEAQEKAAEQDFDLIIVDYYLPDGTGDALCRHLRASERNRRATLAIITGGYRESIIKKCLDAGAIECMFKNEAKELFVTRVTSLARAIETRLSIEAERRRLDGILASVGDGVYGVDAGGRLTFINPAGVDLLGHGSATEMVGELATDALHYPEEDESDEPAAERLVDYYGSGESLSAHETMFRHASGKPVPVECTAFPLSIQSQRMGTVVVFRDISERKSAEQLRWEVSHDPLTGLSNRRHFSQLLDKGLKRLEDAGGYDALLYVDLDRFRDVVEALGPSESDRLLAEIGSRLTARLREPDHLARLEGDRFALLLCEIQLANLFTIADDFRNVLAEVRYDFHGASRPVTGSIGVVILTRHTPSAEYALEHARVACENAKKKGRNQTHIYISEDDGRTVRELESGWEERFKEAVRKDRFVFLAQPIIPGECLPTTVEVDLSDPAIPRLTRADGRDELIFELLLRMVSNDGQWISPSVFVPLAERVNMVQEIDLWVVRKALARLEQLAHSEYNVCLTINISNVTLQDPEVLPLIRDAIESYRIEPSRLIFEVTETAEIASLHNARKFMVELKKLGCRFALDDFGTGFSSFSHLKHLPVHFIKIDGLFVQAMVSNAVDRTMVSSMIDMAHALGLGTIAEHVNSASTLEAVHQAGIDYVQGNFLGEPILIDNLDIEGMFGNQMKTRSS